MNDAAFIVLVAVVILALVAIVAFMLNRSWGNFPSRSGLPSTDSASPWTPLRAAAPPTVWSADQPSAEEDGEEDEEDGEEDEEDIQESADPPAAGGLVRIEHPLVRRAAEAALRKGGPMTKYIVGDGDQIYFNFDAISDPA